MNKIDFYKNLIDASSIEQRFIFLDDDGYLPAPKRLSTAGAGAAQAAMYAGAAVGLIALGAAFGGPGFAQVPLFSRGNNNVDGLTVELRKYKPVADVVGVLLRTGEIVLRLGIDANELTPDDLTRLFYGFSRRRSV